MQGARGATVYICTIPYIFQDFEVLSRERRFGEVRGVFEEVWSDLIGVDILLFNPGDHKVHYTVHIQFCQVKSHMS